MQGNVIGLVTLLINSRFSFTCCTCTLLLWSFVNTLVSDTFKTELLASLLSKQADEFRLLTNQLFPLILFRSSQNRSQDILGKGHWKTLCLTWHDSKSRQGNWRMHSYYSLAQIERYLQELAAPWTASPNCENTSKILPDIRLLLQVSSLHKQDVLHSTKGAWLQTADLGDSCWQ